MNHREWRAVRWARGLAVAAGMGLALCAAPGQALADDAEYLQLLERMQSLADRMHEARGAFRESGTLLAALKGSFWIQYCMEHNGGGSLSLGAETKAKGEFAVGFGKILAELGWDAGVRKRGSTSAKLSGNVVQLLMSWWCWDVSKMGEGVGNAFQMAPYDIADHEPPFLHYTPPEARQLTTNGADLREHEMGLRTDVGDLLGLKPAELVNAIVDGYVALGLDPANEAQVRQLIMGMEWDSAELQQAFAFSGSPASWPLQGMNRLRQVADTLPFAGRWAAALDSLLAIDSLGDACAAFDAQGLCGEISGVRSALASAGNSSLASSFSNLASSIDGLDGAVAHLGSRISLLQDTYGSLSNYLGTFQGYTQTAIHGIQSLWTLAGHADTKYSQLQTVITALTDEKNHFETQICKTHSFGKSVNWWSGNVCVAIFNVQPCVPSTSMHVNCY